MNKQELIEEFKKEIEEVKIRTNWNENFKNYEKGKKSGLRYGLSLVEKLDEPKLPVIPHGYTIAEEKLYRVLMPNRTFLVQSDIENYEHWFNVHVEMYDNVTYEFTEQEIKAIDERYWAFAEPVSEQEQEPKLETQKTRQVLVKFFDNEEYKTELTEESARELIEFLEANKNE